MHRRPRAGFTLIELLVVISIISMLSSVILVSLQSARDKGRVGGGVQFASHNFQGLGATALLYWKFDSDTIAGGASDWSGNGAGGTFTGGTLDTANTPAAGGKDYVVGSSGQYVGVSSIQNPPSFTDHTVSVWIYPTGGITSGYGSGVLNGFNGSNKIIAMNITSSGLIVGWNGCYNSAPISATIQPNKWQQVTYTYNASSGYITAYLDGRQVGKQSATSYCPSVPFGTNSLSSFYAGAYTAGFTGSVDDVVVYGQTLTAAQVEHIYAEGRSTHVFAQR